MTGKTAMVLGATGLVGSALLRLLLDDENYHLVRVLARREPLPGFASTRLDWQVVDFDKSLAVSLFRDIDEIFCCLGTTMKKAGSKQAFIEQDFQLPASLASQACEHGFDLKHFLIVTSLTADRKLPVFHLRVKYDLEQRLKVIFKSSSTIVSAIRPSLIMGQRETVRPAEKLAEWLFGMPSRLLFKGPLASAAGIRGEEVAEAMWQLANCKKVEPPVEYERIC